MNRITVDANNPTVKTILLQLNKFLNLRKKNPQNKNTENRPVTACSAVRVITQYFLNVSGGTGTGGSTRY